MVKPHCAQPASSQRLLLCHHPNSLVLWSSPGSLSGSCFLNYTPDYSEIELISNYRGVSVSPAAVAERITHRFHPLLFSCSSTFWPLYYLRNLWKCWRYESPSVGRCFGKMPTKNVFPPLLWQPWFYMSWWLWWRTGFRLSPPFHRPCLGFST